MPKTSTLTTRPLVIKRVPIAQVIPWEDNPRGIRVEDFERLKHQILELGVYKPLLVVQEKGKYVVLGGNMRLRALQALGAQNVEVSIIEAKTKADRIKYALSDNDRAGFYEDQKLAELVLPHMDEINLADYHVDLGQPLDLKSLLERFGPDFDEKAEEVPEIDDSPAITRPGQVFQLGRHRLMCGDSLSSKDMARLMGEMKSDLVFTDPPYNVDYGSSKNHPTWKIRSIANDNMDDAAWIKFNLALVEILKAYHKGGDVYIWGASGPAGMRQRLAFIDAGIHWSATIIWKKQQLVLSPARYQRMYEPCFYGWLKKSTYRGDRKQTEIWEANKPVSSEQHPTMKPVELCARGVVNSSKPGQIVLDLFMGSGSTLIAAEISDRTCYGMELEPKYCDVIIKRFSKYTGISEREIRQTAK